MKLLILSILLSFNLVHVPYKHKKGIDLIYYRNIASKFHLKYRRVGHNLYIGKHVKVTPTGKVYFRGRRITFLILNGYTDANNWAYLLSKIEHNRKYYWESNKKGFIVSQYPPSVRLKKVIKHRDKVTYVFEHNVDIRPILKKSGRELILFFPRGFIEAYPNLFSSKLVSGMSFQHTISGFKLKLRLARNVAYASSKSLRTLSLTLIKRRGRDTVRRSFREIIVIDPGHGGKDPGAIGYHGIKEKDITLAIAKEVKRIAERRLGVKVVLTRNRDVFIPLWERSKIANRLGAMLFISIHCNYSRNRYARGLETYFLSNARTKWERAVAALENSSVKYEIGYKKQYEMVKKILGDMAQNRYLKESQILAQYVHESILSKTGAYNRGIKQAGFYVLLFTHTPSILVEAGFITDRREARKLRTRWYIRRIAEGIVDGISLYINKYASRAY